MYLGISEIRTLQLDHTSRCNLRCPQCARTSGTGGPHSGYPANRDLSVENYRLLLEPFRDRTLKIFHCGNYGDAVASPTFVETLDFAMDYVPGAYFTVITNGSLQTPEWWAAFGRKLRTRPPSQVCFSVDGLEDTNPIYRVGSNFRRIIANIEAFTGAGGRARWDYLVFEHNRHQVGAARELAARLGVAEFNLKNTSRFVVTDSEKYEAVVQNKKTTVRDIAQNPNREAYEKIKREYASFDDYAASTPITCKYQRDHALYVDFEMRLWPCCWMGAPLYSEDRTLTQTRHIERLMAKYGADFNRLDLHGWDILQHDFFSRYLARSWERNFNDADTPRLFTCGRTCGEKYEFSSGYGKNKNPVKVVSLEAAQ